MNTNIQQAPADNQAQLLEPRKTQELDQTSFSKKEYKTPEIELLGNVRDLTRKS